MGTVPCLPQGEEMLWRGVTLVPSKSVPRVKRINLFHDPVARDLGDVALAAAIERLSSWPGTIIAV